MTKRQTHLWWVIYILALGIYSIFSYSLTAPNLILSHWAPYWNFQTWMWQTFFNNRPLLTYAFIGIGTLLFASYWMMMRAWQHRTFSIKEIIVLTLISAAPLMISNNALSYDVFNYIFNAKMVTVYQANPHVKVALDFPDDTWTRFMHNTHTAAPYGYGWTAVSLVPFSAGLGKFTLTWMLFRGFSLLSLVLLAWTLAHFAKSSQRWWVVATVLNPLLLIEIVSNSHNDLWMMVPALISLLMLTRKKTLPLVVLSAFLLVFSISIKFATALLLPIWLLLVIAPTLIKSWWPFAASCLLFTLLLTSRSQQFHPWYLTWILVWIPLMSERVWQKAVLILTISSFFRYVPYLWAGLFTPTVIMQQKMVTWVPFIVITTGLLIKNWQAKPR